MWLMDEIMWLLQLERLSYCRPSPAPSLFTSIHLHAYNTVHVARQGRAVLGGLGGGQGVVEEEG